MFLREWKWRQRVISHILALFLVMILYTVRYPAQYCLYLTCWFGCSFCRSTCCGVRGAVIKLIDLFYVYFTEALPLTNGGVPVFRYDRWEAITSESVFSIVHYGAIVIRQLQRVCFSVVVFLKVEFLI